MSIYRIRIAPAVYHKIKPNQLTHTSEQLAIDALEKAFQENNIMFTIKADGSEKKFLNESGGELAAVVCEYVFTDSTGAFKRLYH